MSRNEGRVAPRSCRAAVEHRHVGLRDAFKKSWPWASPPPTPWGCWCLKEEGAAGETQTSAQAQRNANKRQREVSSDLEGRNWGTPAHSWTLRCPSEPNLLVSIRHSPVDGPQGSPFVSLIGPEALIHHYEYRQLGRLWNPAVKVSNQEKPDDCWS